MEQKDKISYSLDNSAMIHLASRKKYYTNSFRISVTLTENVTPCVLQKALDHIMVHFPTIVAGIRRGVSQYEVVPCDRPPAVSKDQENLSCMSDDMIRTCAMRVLYKNNKISVEIFHALTDGYGGFVFTQALVEEYLFIKYGICPARTEEQGNRKDWVRDDYVTYAGRKMMPVDHRKVYCLPDNEEKGQKIHITTGIYDVQEISDTAHRFGVTITAFLTAVMASSIIEIEAERASENNFEPVQIMVPVNLRKIFESSSLRNFSLYALPCIEPDEFRMPFETLVKKIDRQLKKQCSKEHLEGMISTNVKLQNMRMIRSIPLTVKEMILRLCFHIYGEHNSCLTLSNLGIVSFPKELETFIERTALILTPRRNSPYNCGITSYKGKMYISFSRRGKHPELEQSFFRHLSDLGCNGMWEINNTQTFF